MDKKVKIFLRLLGSDVEICLSMGQFCECIKVPERKTSRRKGVRATKFRERSKVVSVNLRKTYDRNSLRLMSTTTFANRSQWSDSMSSSSSSSSFGYGPTILVDQREPVQPHITGVLENTRVFFSTPVLLPGY